MANVYWMYDMARSLARAGELALARCLYERLVATASDKKLITMAKCDLASLPATPQETRWPTEEVEPPLAADESREPSISVIRLVRGEVVVERTEWNAERQESGLPDENQMKQEQEQKGKNGLHTNRRTTFVYSARGNRVAVIDTRDVNYV